MVKQLEEKLKDVDLVSLQRIQVTEVLKRDFLEPEDVQQCMPAAEPSSIGEYETGHSEKLWVWTAGQPLALALV